MERKIKDAKGNSPSYGRPMGESIMDRYYCKCHGVFWQQAMYEVRRDFTNYEPYNFSYELGRLCSEGGTGNKCPICGQWFYQQAGQRGKKHAKEVQPQGTCIECCGMLETRRAANRRVSTEYQRKHKNLLLNGE